MGALATSTKAAISMPAECERPSRRQSFRQRAKYYRATHIQRIEALQQMLCRRDAEYPGQFPARKCEANVTATCCNDDAIAAQHEAAIAILKAGNRTRQPTDAWAIGVEAPHGGAQTYVNTGVEQLGDRRIAGNEGFQHRRAVAHRRAEALAEVQRNVVAHGRGRHRVLIDQHDFDAEPRRLGRRGHTGGTSADDEELGGFLNRQPLAGYRFRIAEAAAHELTAAASRGDADAARRDAPCRSRYRSTSAQYQSLNRITSASASSLYGPGV